MGDNEPSNGPGNGLAPLRRMAFGMILVIADLRINGLDLVPDPFGWVLVVMAASQVRSLHPAFPWSVVAGAVGLVVSLPGWVGVEGRLIDVVDTLASTVLIFATCTGVAALSRRQRRFAVHLRWWHLGLAVLALATALLEERTVSLSDPLAPLLVVWGLAVLVVIIGFVVLLFRAAREGSDPALPPPG